MELDKLFGLPAHPLLVHIPVVIVPMAALIAIVFAFRPAWLDRFGWGLVALTGLGALGAILAAGSGESLQETSKASRSAVQDHAEMGDTARLLAFLFFLVVTAAVVLRYWSKRNGTDGGVWNFIRSKGGAIAIAVILVLSASGAMYAVSVAGHSGAKLKWGTTQTGG